MSLMGKTMADSLREFADCKHDSWTCNNCKCSTALSTLTMNERILRSAIEDGGFDLSPCGNCGTPVVCIPDGLPMCKDCALADE